MTAAPGEVTDAPADAPVWRGPSEIRRLTTSIVMGEAAGVMVPLIVMALLAHISTQALYVRSLYVPLAFLFAAVQIGFDVANQVAASTSRGRNRPEDVMPVAMSMVRVGAIVWGGMTLLVILGAPLLAVLFHVPPDSSHVFVSFARWVSLATLLFFPTVLCASSLRGSGHATAAATIVVTGAAIEVGGVALLGFTTNLGVFALPIAIAVGGAAALTIGLTQLHRTGLWRIRGPLVWRPEAVGRLLSVGLPVSISFVVIAASNAGMLWILSAFGPIVVSGFAAASSLGALILVPATSLGSATAIVFNRLRGAGRTDLGLTVLRAGLKIAAVLYTGLAAAIWLARGMLAHLIAGSAGVAAETEHFFAIVALSYAGMGLTVMSVLFIEQIGGGVIALLLNIPYFGGIVVVGGIAARSTGSSTGLYVTMAVLNASGVLVAPLIAWLFTRRLVRTHAATGDDHPQAGPSPVAAPVGAARTDTG